MTQPHPTKPSIKRQLLKLLEDGQWHGCNDLIQFGTRYAARICELRDEGYDIISAKEDGHPTYRYRLAIDR